MDVQSWFVEHGETAQYAAYFTLLVAMALLELRAPARSDGTRRRRWATNFSLTLVNIVVLGALPTSFVVAAEWARASSFGWMNSVELPSWATLVVGLLARGFISWITHLLMHRVPLLWRVHRVHHTDVGLDVSTTVRFHPLEFPINLALGLPWVLALGIPPWVLLAYECVDVCVNVFSHANVDLPRALERRLRLVLVTPGLHRIHHSADQEETDSNFSAVFPIWDRVFGTLRTTTARRPGEMPLGLREVRDARTVSLPWLFAAPFRRTQPEAPAR